MLIMASQNLRSGEVVFHVAYCIVLIAAFATHQLIAGTHPQVALAMRVTAKVLVSSCCALMAVLFWRIQMRAIRQRPSTRDFLTPECSRSPA